MANEQVQELTTPDSGSVSDPTFEPSDSNLAELMRLVAQYRQEVISDEGASTTLLQHMAEQLDECCSYTES